jgi:hypothetical protein
MQVEGDEAGVVITNAFSRVRLKTDDILSGEFRIEKTGPARHVGVVVNDPKKRVWVRLMPVALDDIDEFTARLSELGSQA